MEEMEGMGGSSGAATLPPSSASSASTSSTQAVPAASGRAAAPRMPSEFSRAMPADALKMVHGEPLTADRFRLRHCAAAKVAGRLAW